MVIKYVQVLSHASSGKNTTGYSCCSRGTALRQVYCGISCLTVIAFPHLGHSDSDNFKTKPNLFPAERKVNLNKNFRNLLTFPQLSSMSFPLLLFAIFRLQFRNKFHVIFTVIWKNLNCSYHLKTFKSLVKEFYVNYSESQFPNISLSWLVQDIDCWWER